MNSIIGSAALVVALLAAVATVVVSVMASRSQSRALEDLSRHGVYVVLGAVLVAGVALLNAFIEHDFGIRYVQRYSDTRMPTIYLVSAFWGGQSGSLLFWAIVLCLFSAGAAYFAQDRTPELMPWTHAILMVVASFFFVLLIFVSNPFDSYVVINDPVEGHGLNPLLQNYWMAIHPPFLLIGYASMAVPFAFGMSALLTGRLNLDWIKVTRRWLLVAWTFLGVGCILGGRWAYEELGWGGYWAWDPVENAAILPWFTGTALLHSVMVQENRGMLKRWNVFLLVLTFWLSIFGTFLTRSGILSSVHSFAESGIGSWFLGFLIFIAGASAVVMRWRWKALAPRRRLESYLSRESMFLLNNWILLALTFVVAWGTLFPKIKDVLVGEEASIGPPWFNRFVFPLGLVLLLAMALGTMIAWRRATKRNVARNFKLPVIIATLLTPALIGLYFWVRLTELRPAVSNLYVVYALLAIYLIVFNIAVIAIEFSRGVRSRKSKTGAGAMTALFSLIAKHRRRYGGYLVHIGFALVILGIAGNAFRISQRATLGQGESVALGDYLVTFDGIEIEQHPDKVAFFANLRVQQCDRVGDGVELASCGSATVMRPARFDYNDYTSVMAMPDPSKITSEIAVRTRILEDVYIAPSGLHLQENVASFEMFVNPFVFWIWFGGVVLLAASVVCFWPDRVRVRQQARLRRLRPAADRMAMILVALLPALALFDGGRAQAQEPVEAPPGSTATDDASAGHEHEQAESQSDSEVRLVEGDRREGSVAANLYSRIRCACEGCGGATLANCAPTCGHGREDRQRIDAWLAEGKSADEIIAIFVAERGEMALAIPKDPMMVWAIPIGGVIFGVLIVWLAIRSLRQSRRGPGGRDGSDRPPTTRARTPRSGSLTGYQERLALELSELD